MGRSDPQASVTRPETRSKGAASKWRRWCRRGWWSRRWRRGRAERSRRRAGGVRRSEHRILWALFPAPRFWRRRRRRLHGSRGRRRQPHPRRQGRGRWGRRFLSFLEVYRSGPHLPGQQRERLRNNRADHAIAGVADAVGPRRLRAHLLGSGDAPRSGWASGPDIAPRFGRGAGEAAPRSARARQRTDRTSAGEDLLTRGGAAGPGSARSRLHLRAALRSAPGNQRRSEPRCRGTSGGEADDLNRR